ncbi:MAG: NYN domain-containing protein [Planctomycetota bacterium]|nr:NYN domain-containing protein [Planctomycetota bacterium]
MDTQGSICRIGVFYDGSFFSHAQRYFYHDRKVGWLSFQPFHGFLEQFVRTREQDFASYKVVYAAWHQGLFSSKGATEDQLRFERNRYHDLLHAGIEAKYLPMSQSQGEKGTDVALAVDALQVGLDGKIDIAVLVSGDGDFVPLVRALNKQGIRVLAAYFEFTDGKGRKCFINERLLNCCNYSVDVSTLDKSREFRGTFKTLFRRTDEWKDKSGRGPMLTDVAGGVAEV